MKENGVQHGMLMPLLSLSLTLFSFYYYNYSLSLVVFSCCFNKHM